MRATSSAGHTLKDDLDIDGQYCDRNHPPLPTWSTRVARTFVSKRLSASVAFVALSPPGSSCRPAGQIRLNQQAFCAAEGGRINGRRLTVASRIGLQDCGPIDMATPAQAPSRWRRAERRGESMWWNKRERRQEANVPFHLAFTLRDLGERAKRRSTEAVKVDD